MFSLFLLVITFSSCSVVYHQIAVIIFISMIIPRIIKEIIAGRKWSVGSLGDSAGLSPPRRDRAASGRNESNEKSREKGLGFGV